MAVFEPKIIEVVGEAGKATVSVHPLVAGRGTSVGDVLESTFDIETEVIVDEEFQTA